jgi:hypothetical protein
MAWAARADGLGNLARARIAGVARYAPTGIVGPHAARTSAGSRPGRGDAGAESLAGDGSEQSRFVDEMAVKGCHPHIRSRSAAKKSDLVSCHEPQHAGAGLRRWRLEWWRSGGRRGDGFGESVGCPSARYGGRWPYVATNHNAAKLELHATVVGRCLCGVSLGFIANGGARISLRAASPGLVSS